MMINDDFSGAVELLLLCGDLNISSACVIVRSKQKNKTKITYTYSTHITAIMIFVCFPFVVMRLPACDFIITIMLAIGVCT